MTHHLLESLVRAFVDSKLTPLLLLSILLLGSCVLVLLPREEEPQIVIPMVDIFVAMPGASSKEIEKRISIPLEKQLAEIAGVEYVYSIARPGLSMATAIFYLGEDAEEAAVKLYNKLFSQLDRLPAGASQPLIKVRSIDDVPIVALTLSSEHYNSYTLRRVAAELDDHIRDIPGVSETHLIGGQPRQMKIIVQPDRLAAFQLDVTQLLSTLTGANTERTAGRFSQANTEYTVKVGGFLGTAEAVEQLVVGLRHGKPIYLKDVAQVEDGPAQVKDYVFFAGGPGRPDEAGSPVAALSPAVILSVAKRPGTNAVSIADQIIAKVEALTGTLIPRDIQLTVTRNYGETAQRKFNELLEHLLIAVFAVTLFISLFLGGRAALVVFIAVPATLALTLGVYYLGGYTLNRITFFGLILSIGILVDDPIVDVENIVRHYQLPENRSRSPLAVTVEAVNEVRSPLILATLAVILSILPLTFVGGMTGAYARPVPVGAVVAMLFSMAVAFVITPWSAYKLLKSGHAEGRSAASHEEGWTTQVYRRLMAGLLRSPWKQSVFLGSIVVLFIGALVLLFSKAVIFKLLPYDNRSEFKVMIDMPEGTTLEDTARVTTAIGAYLGTVPEVVNYQLCIGTASPYDFNGFVRRYFLRQDAHLADIHVNLVPKGNRDAQLHDIVKRLRPDIVAIAQSYGARITMAESPPGPPVRQTLVAEVYGPDYGAQIAAARKVRDLFHDTLGVVDVDWSVEAAAPVHRFQVDQEKSSLHGIPTTQIVQTLQIALEGVQVGLFHLPEEKEEVPLFVHFPRPARSSLQDLQSIRLATPQGGLVPLSELVRIENTSESAFIYRKNLKRVVYVTGDVAGVEDSPLYVILKLDTALSDLALPRGQQLRHYYIRQPFVAEQLALKWDGEWQVTYDFVRNLGFAFLAAILGIYILIVAWFQSFLIPLIILTPIPLSLIGIIPAHWLTGFFLSATSLIGFIAGAGIVVRNSIILVDFTRLRQRQGMSLIDAVVDAGAVRFRPMLLTAASVVVGTAVILFDPIFQGLALALMAGEVASTFLSRLVVPLLYYRLYAWRTPAEEVTVAEANAGRLDGKTSKLGNEGAVSSKVAPEPQTRSDVPSQQSHSAERL